MTSQAPVRRVDYVLPQRNPLLVLLPDIRPLEDRNLVVDPIGEKILEGDQPRINHLPTVAGDIVERRPLLGTTT